MVLQYSLVYKEDRFGGVSAMAPGGPSQTCSLECPSPSCTLGDNGSRYKTPELEAASRDSQTNFMPSGRREFVCFILLAGLSGLCQGCVVTVSSQILQSTCHF